MERDFAAAAESETGGGDDDGLGRKFYGLGHALKLADGEVDVVPLFFLNGHEEEHEIGADGEILGVVGDDEGFEGVAGASGLEGLEDEGDNVGAEGVHLGVEFDAGDAIAEVDQGCAGIFLDHTVGFLGDSHRPDSGGNFHWFPVLGSQFPVTLSRGSFGVVLIPSLFSGGEEFFDVGGDGAAFLFHAGYGRFNAGGIPELEGAEFPVEAEVHGAVDFDDGVGDFGNAIGGVGPEIGKRGPEESGGLVGLFGLAAVEAEQ